MKITAVQLPRIQRQARRRSAPAFCTSISIAVIWFIPQASEPFDRAWKSLENGNSSRPERALQQRDLASASSLIDVRAGLVLPCAVRLINPLKGTLVPLPQSRSLPAAWRYRQQTRAPRLWSHEIGG